MGRRKREKVSKAQQSNNSNLLWMIAISFCVLWIAIGTVSYSKFGLQVPDVPGPSSNPLVPLSQQEVQDLMTKRKTAYATRYQDGKHDSFTMEEIEWMAQSKDAYLILIGADLLLQRNETTKAINIYESFIDLDPTLDNIPSGYFDIAYNKLIIHYATINDPSNTGNIVRKALAAREHDSHVDRWFTLWMESLIATNQMDRAYNVGMECLEAFKSIEILNSKFCLERMGALETYRENLEQAQEYYIQGYNACGATWINSNGTHCPAEIVPLSLSDIPENILHLQQQTIISEISLDESIDTKCTEQNFPFYSNQGNLEYFNYHPYEELGCYKAKKTILHSLENIIIQGEYKTLIHEENNKCTIFVPGFPFHEAKAQPIPSQNTIPVKKIGKVLLLQAFDRNFNHFTTEGLSKVFLALEDSVLNGIDELKILVSRTKFSEEFFELLGILDRVVFYEPQMFQYSVETLFIIEWKVTEKLTKPIYYPIEHQLPPSVVLHKTHQKLLALIPERQERNLVVFIQRNEQPRMITEASRLYEMFEYLTGKFALEFRVHDADELSIKEQMELSNRAVALVGYHGAGLANMMFCREDTAIIEIPVSPIFVSYYARMASILRFPYYTVPDATIGRYDSIKSLPEKAMNQLEYTLYLALVTQGFSVSDK